MKYWQLAGSTAALALFAGTSAIADVTPEEVWQNWQDTASATGQTVTSESAERDGDALVITGLSISSDKDGAKSDATLEELVLTDNGDGTVTVTMSDEYLINMTMPALEGIEGAEPTVLTMTLSQPGMTTLASGTPDAINYEFTAPTMAFKVLTATSADAEPQSTIEGNLTAVSGKYLVSGTPEAQLVDTAFNAEGLALTIVGADANTQSNVQATMTIADIVLTSNSNLAGMENTDFSKALAAGFSTDTSVSYGATTFDINVSEAETNSKVIGAAVSGAFAVLLNATTLNYSAEGKGVSMAVSGSDIPVPEVKVTYSEAGFNLKMPVGVTDEPTEFALLTKVVDLAFSEDVWALLDPTGQLPHDPATVIIDSKGTGKLSVNIMDSAAMEALGDATPGELYSLDVTELRATMLGAELTGAGAFTFDNTDTTTYGGMPAPTGKLDLKLVGSNALMDKLVAMGLVPEEQVMSFRMMASMFANATEGADELTSTLEFKDGGFFANGQQLQ